MAADKSITNVVVVPSHGDHPDDFDEAVKPGYWPHSNLAKECNFVIHRTSDGQVHFHDMDRPVRDGTATVVFLGRGDRRLSPAEVEAFESMVGSLRKEKRISGRLKQTVNGGLLFKEDEVPQADLPDNRDTTPPEQVTEAEPDPQPQSQAQPEDADEDRAGAAAAAREQLKAAREQLEASDDGDDDAPRASKP